MAFMVITFKRRVDTHAKADDCIKLFKMKVPISILR